MKKKIEEEFFEKSNIFGFIKLFDVRMLEIQHEIAKTNKNLELIAKSLSQIVNSL